MREKNLDPMLKIQQIAIEGKNGSMFFLWGDCMCDL